MQGIMWSELNQAQRQGPHDLTHMETQIEFQDSVFVLTQTWILQAF